MAVNKLKNKENGQILAPATEFTKRELLKSGLYEEIKEKEK